MATLKQTFPPDPPKGVRGVSEFSDHVWKSASPSAHVLCPTSPIKSRGHCPYLRQLSPGTGEAVLRPHSWRPSLSFFGCLLTLNLYITVPPSAGLLQFSCLPQHCPCWSLSCACLLQGQPGRKGFPGKPGPDGSKVRRCGPPWGGGGGRGASLTYKAPGQALNPMASEVGEKSGPYSSQGIGNRRGKSSRYSHSVQQPGLSSNGVQADTRGGDCECGVQCRQLGGRL